jgi:hypothetical protein
MKIKYTVDFFIKKFSKIRKNHWTTGDWCDEQGRRCAEGWCYSSRYPNGKSANGKYSPMVNALNQVFANTVKNDAIGFNDNNPVSMVNFSITQFLKLEDHPKVRILFALKRAKQILKKKGLVNHDFRKPIS